MNRQIYRVQLGKEWAVVEATPDGLKPLSKFKTKRDATAEYKRTLQRSERQGFADALTIARLQTALREMADDLDSDPDQLHEYKENLTGLDQFSTWVTGRLRGKVQELIDEEAID